MRIDFEGRVVVVTGGAGALGRAIVGAVLDAGGRCVVPMLGEGDAPAAWGDEDRVRTLAGVDLRDDEAVVSFYEDASRHGLWASIHAAGGFAMSPIVETASDDLRRMLELNTVTAFACTREAVRRMSGGGRVVNIAARCALFPELGGSMAAYVSSKAALAALTQAAAVELAGSGVLVNAVVPDVMDTPTNRQAMPDANFDAWADVADVAASVAFLASPQNTATRGGLVPVYGRG